MKIAALTLVSLLVAVQSPSPSQQDTALDLKKEATAIIERNIRAEFEHTMKEVFWPKMANASEEDKKLGLKSTKWLFYNKAYAYYRCGTTDARGSSDVKLIEREFVRCFEDHAAQFKKTLKLVDYAPAIDLHTQIQCEMRSRLFEAELEFPAFDFLQGDGVYLLDYKKWNDCLLGAAR